VAEIHTGLSLMTVEEHEKLKMHRQVHKALEAGEFFKALSYPSEQEAIRLVQDGNLTNVPFSMDNVRRFFDMYGVQILSLRGKTTKKHVIPSTQDAMESKEQITRQELLM